MEKITGVILAAGRGTRIANVSKGIPKGLVELGGKTLLMRQIEMFLSYDVKDILVVAGYEAELVRAAADDFATVVENPLFATTNSIYSFWCARERVFSDFICVNCDSLYEKTITDALFEDKRELVLPMDRKLALDGETKVVLDGDRIIRIGKDVPTSEADGGIVGIVKVSGGMVTEIKRAAEKMVSDGKTNAFFSEAVQQLTDWGHAGYCFDIGNRFRVDLDTEQDYEIAKKHFANGTAKG